jgi:hypothetical protein
MEFLKKAIEAAGLASFDDTPAAAVTQPATTVMAPQAATTAPSTPLSLGASINQQMVDDLMKAATQRRTQFTTLMENADKLKAVLPDELTRIKSAFAIVAGGDPSFAGSLLQSFQLHLADVDAAARGFERDAEAQVATAKVTLEQANAEATEATQLRQRAADLDGEAAQLTTQGNQMMATVDNARAEFARAHSHVKGTINKLKADVESALR